MDANKFRTFVRNAPRNYSVVVMLTALQPQRQCSVCRGAFEDFQVVASSWRHSNAFNTKLFIALVDYDDGGNEVFNSMKINSAPAIIHFPEKGKPKKIDTMDIYRLGFSAEAVVRFINDRTSINIRIVRPPNYTAILTYSLAFLVVGAVLYWKRNSLGFLANKTLWSFIILSVIFFMISGQMWNHIRSPPFNHKNPQNGQVTYVHPDFDTQFVSETYLIFAINAAIVMGMVLLAETSSLIGEGPRKKVVVCFGLGMVVTFFSLLLSIFRSKYQGYPYSFLFK